jgi:hypothetical protein
MSTVNINNYQTKKTNISTYLISSNPQMLPTPRINLTDIIPCIIKAFQTIPIAEQARERLKLIKKLSVAPTYTR